MDNQRSPRYPACNLADAIVAIRALWAKEKRTSINGEVLSRALGYKSHSGPARTMIGALRQYGLLEKSGGGLRLSGIAMQIVHSIEGSQEQLSAIREAALTPELFRDLHSTHSDASEDAIKSHLILKKGFSEGGARLAASAYKNTLSLAKPTKEGYNPKKEEREELPQVKIGDLVQWEPQGVSQFRELPKVRALSEDGQWAFVDGSETGIPVKELVVEKQAAGDKSKTDTPVLNAEAPKLALPVPPVPVHLFSWPLSKDVVAEVKFTGMEITAAHLELLRSYLDLAKQAMSGAAAPAKT